MVNNTVYHFVDSNLGVTEKEVNGKRVRSNRGLGHLCTLQLVFQENLMQCLSVFYFYFIFFFFFIFSFFYLLINYLFIYLI